MRNNEYMQTKGCNVLSSFIRQIAWRIPLALCCLTFVASLFSCDSDKPDNLEPQLTTLSATGITRTDATLNGQATVEGETEMPQLYFRYGLTEEMEQTATAVRRSHRTSQDSPQPPPIIICLRPRTEGRL